MTYDDAVAALAAHRPAVIVVGASAGAIDVLDRILPSLPAAFAVPMVVVVHVPAERPSGLAELFAERCQLPVYEVEDKCPLTNAVYFAPPDYHVLVERTGTLALSTEDAVHFSRPAIDVLFESAADAFLHKAMGILLSGASADGAAGLARIRSAGGLTWVQAPATAAAVTMPESALALGPHAVLTPDEMSRALAAWGIRP